MTSRPTRRSLTARCVTGLAVAVTSTTLAASVSAPPAQAAGQITVALRDGVLHVAGNDTANVVRLSRASDGRIMVTADSRIARRGGSPTVRNVRSIRVSVRAGDDVVRLYAGLPPATVLGEAGDDRLVGGTAAETLRGGPGTDQLLGGGGADLLMGEAANDNLFGQDGVDRLVGGDGSDSLLGGAGDDILRGEAGDDSYLFDPELAQGTDAVREFPGQGSDTVHFNGYGSVTFSLGSADPQVISSSLTLRLEAVDTFENVHGGLRGDVLTGNALANRINGGGGDDQLTGAGGADVYVPGDNWAEWMDDQWWPGYSGADTVADFAEDDTVELDGGKEVTAGIGTSTVSISGPYESGSVTAPGHTFDDEDFS